MRKLVLSISLLCFLLGDLGLFSQNVVIKGKIRSESGIRHPADMVRLLIYDDMLTCEQTTVAETFADEGGVFVVAADIDKITPAQIAIGLERVDIILKPSSEYNVEITIPRQEENASYYERLQPVMKMTDSTDDLYYQYYKAEKVVDDFVLGRFEQLYKRRQKSLLDSLDAFVERELGEARYGFVDDYLRYRRANIQMMLDNDDARNVAEQYFGNNEILYLQPAYMTLFNEIFSNYLVSRRFEPSELLSNLRKGHDIFMEYVKTKDDILSGNHELAELVVAWNMKRMYYENPDERRYIVGCMEGIRRDTDSEENRKVVDNILTQLYRLAFDTEAPQFSMKDAGGNTVSLSDYSDNIVLLQFVNKVSPMTDYQFQELDNISRHWPDMIKIVTVATDDSFDDFRQMIEKNSYKWKLLKLDSDILLLEKYQIRTFPDYIIIMPQNKIGMAPAPAPDQYLDYHMKRIYNHVIKK